MFQSNTYPINRTEVGQRLLISVDISSDIQLMFVYLDIIHHHIVGDAKAPLLRVLVSNRRVKTVACITSIIKKTSS